jgi:hypothetical protein
MAAPNEPACPLTEPVRTHHLRVFEEQEMLGLRRLHKRTPAPPVQVVCPAWPDVANAGLGPQPRGLIVAARQPL